LLAVLSSCDTLVMHLGMTGEFRIDGLEATSGVRAEPDRHDNVLFEMSTTTSTP